MIFQSKKKIKVGIVGGAGYGGTELIKLLIFHPKVVLSFVTSRKHSGVKISQVHRFLRGATELLFVEPDIETLPKDIDLVFLATPHGTSMSLVPRIMKRMPKTRIIDLSGDFRLEDPEVYRQYYGKEHSASDLLGKFVYGLTEFNRSAVSQARYVANPGCFATGIIFPLFPLLKAGAVKDSVCVVAVTGSSGSGELPKDVTHHPVRAKNFKSYKILEHQHIPEIELFVRESFFKGYHETPLESNHQAPRNAGAEMRPDRRPEQRPGPKIGFVPQSGPFVRGIFTTVMVYNPDIEGEEIGNAFDALYRKEKFVRIVDSSPEVTMVYGTNFVEVAWACRQGFVVSMSAIDNLVKGASGQAVQNMNVMFGFAEEEGIRFPGMLP
jgi:N-acetyl-gamma-glutamyl-phosphate/LysW-gamma-L-alpha-aminoadipyl-6-phosphate reductase